MSLFPAYTTEAAAEHPKSHLIYQNESAIDETNEEEINEHRLLRSSSSEEERPPPAAATTGEHTEFYCDRRRDRANVRVSTLYYPARPQYYAVEQAALDGRRRRRGRVRRYFRAGEPPAPLVPAAADRERLERRARDLRAHLAARPRDQDAWLRAVQHAADWGAELDEAERAAAACDTRRVRDALHAARLRHLAPSAVRDALRDDAVRAPGAAARREAWLRLVAGGVDAGPAGVQRVAAAALAAGAGDARLYPRVLAALAAWAAAAGLWERLTLLVELVAAMNFPPTACFPPPRDAAADAALEADLREREDKVVASGLPSNVVWVRVERLRAAAHWRAAAGADPDPQRHVSAADVHELVRAAPPAARLELAAALLRAAGVPALPAAEHAARALPPGLAQPPDAPGAAAMLRAARRVPRPPPAGAARAALARLLDPPHYFSDRTGFLRWVNALWEACCGWMAGRARLALVCWRLRWLHMLVRLADEDEARRLRGEARAVLRRLAPDAPPAFAHFARIERELRPSEARRVALQAVRAAGRADAAPPEDALFAARVVGEVCGAGEPEARWALCCAALRRALPPDAELGAPPPPHVERAAAAAVEARCAELEREDGDEDEDEEEPEDAEEALLPGVGEWAAARVAFQDAGAARRALAASIVAPAPRLRIGLRFREAQACALTLAAARDGRMAAAADAFLPRFPNNALLALAAGGAARAWGASHCAALAAALGVLLRAEEAAAAGGAPALAAERRLAARCARAAPWGGALLAALGAEAGARAGRAGGAWGAAAAHASHKWVLARGAALWPAEAGALCDALLERELRVHALPDELAPLAP